MFSNNTLKNLESEEFHSSKCGKLFGSFCVYRLMEYIPLCYGSIDNQFWIEKNLPFSIRNIWLRKKIVLNTSYISCFRKIMHSKRVISEFTECKLMYLNLCINTQARRTQ